MTGIRITCWQCWISALLKPRSSAPKTIALVSACINQVKPLWGSVTFISPLSMRPAVAIARLQPTNASGTLSTILAFSKISGAWTAMCCASSLKRSHRGFTNHNSVSPKFFITLATEPRFRAPAVSTNTILIFDIASNFTLLKLMKALQSNAFMTKLLCQVNTTSSS